MKKLTYIAVILTILLTSRANAQETYGIEEHIEANFKTMVWYDMGYFINKEYSEDDMWNLAHQLIDINFFLFQEEIDEKLASGDFSVEGVTPKQLLRLTLADFIYDNHQQWIKEAIEEANEALKMQEAL
jgi:hypothetical protein